jgi:hypothetical protein
MISYDRLLGSHLASTHRDQLKALACRPRQLLLTGDLTGGRNAYHSRSSEDTFVVYTISYTSMRRYGLDEPLHKRETQQKSALPRRVAPGQ